MAATYPADEADTRWPTVSITKEAVTVGTFYLPAHWIGRHGVEIKPDGRINQLVLTLLVGEVVVSDDALPMVAVSPSDGVIETEYGIASDG